MLIYFVITSLDGYVADEDGDFSWGAPDEEVHRFVNELERVVGTYLYGRRMYEVMSVWEDSQRFSGDPEVIQEFARIWQSADKVVYSSTLDSTSTVRTRLERQFRPDAVAALKADAQGDLSVGGPGLAAAALRAGLVDECRLIVAPVVVGGGNHWLPRSVRLSLQLLDERRFASGMVYLRYRVGPRPA